MTKLNIINMNKTQRIIEYFLGFVIYVPIARIANPRWRGRNFAKNGYNKNLELMESDNETMLLQEKEIEPTDYSFGKCSW